MKLAGELLRWFLTLGLAACGIGILWSAYSSAPELGFRSAEGVIAVVFAACFAAVFIKWASLAYQRRWRELLVIPIVVLTILVWSEFLALPRYLSLVEQFIQKTPGSPDWFKVLKGATYTICFFGSFPFAHWFYRRLIAILDRVVPPRVATKEWIQRVC